MSNCVRSGLAMAMRCLVLCMAFWLFVSQACWAAEAELAELPEAPQAQAESSPQPETPALEITILDGEGALNNIRQRTAREPIVQVKDRNRKPVAGVLILFAINDGPSGAGATIGGASTFSAVTDADGRAQARGYTPNSTEGKFTITVTATLGALVALAIIHQENRLGAAGPSESTSNATQSTSGTTQPSQSASSATHSKFHILPKSPIAKMLIVGGIAAGVLVLVLVTTSNRGSNITAGAGSVTHP